MVDKTEMSASAIERNGKFKHLVEHALDLFDQFEQSEYRQTKLEEIKKTIKIYAQKANKATFPWDDASNVILPMVTITVDNLEPRLCAALTGKLPIVQFTTDGESDPVVEALEGWFNDELNQTVNIGHVARTTIHKLLTEGTVYPIASYDEEERLCSDFLYDEQGNIIIGEDGQPQTTEYSNTIFQGGKVDFAEFNDIFVPDQIIDWEKTDIIRRVRPTYGELMRVKDNSGYMNIGPWLINESVDELDEDAQSPTQELINARVTGKETIECLECHLSYVYRKEDEKDADIDDWTEERIIALIAKDSKVLIRLVLLRDINFQNEHVIKCHRLFPEHGQAYGTTIYGKMQAIQDGASDLFNLVINVATICMIPWFLYSDKAGFEDEPVISPGKGIKVDEPREVAFPKFNIQPGAYIQFIEIFMSLWERLGSIGDLQLGRPSEQRKSQTATETMAVIHEGNIKHNYQSQNIKDEFLGLLKTIYDMYYQYMPFDTQITHKGQPIQIPRQMMRRPNKFRLTGSTDLSNKMLEMQMNEQFYGMLRQDPIVNPVSLVGDIINTHKPESTPEKYIAPQISQMLAAIQENPEIPQVVMQYLQQKMTQQEGQQGQSQQG